MFYQSQARYAQENALKEAKNAKIKELEANESKMEAIKQKSIAEKTLYTAYTAQVRFADDAWERGDVIKARQYLDDAQWNLRGWEHDYLAQKFEVTTFRGHSVNVSSVSFSPDGKRIVSGSADKTLKVWDAATGQKTLTLKGHSRPVTSVNFSQEGQRIVSGSGPLDDEGRPSQILVWDSETGLPVVPQADDFKLLRSENPLPSRSGDRIVVAEGWRLVIKRASTGEVLFSGGDDGEVVNPRFSPDGKRVVSGCSNGTVKVWLQAARSAPSILEPKRAVDPKAAERPPESVDAPIQPIPTETARVHRRLEHPNDVSLPWGIAGLFASLIAILALTKGKRPPGRIR